MRHQKNTSPFENKTKIITEDSLTRTHKTDVKCLPRRRKYIDGFHIFLLSHQTIRVSFFTNTIKKM